MSVRDLHRNLATKYQDTPSTSTVYRSIHSSGLRYTKAIKGPFITDTTVKKRVLLCKKNKRQDWNNNFFRDECSVWLQGDNVCMWTKGSETPFLNIPRYVPKLHIWGGISTRGVTVLKIFKTHSILRCILTH